MRNFFGCCCPEKSKNHLDSPLSTSVVRRSMHGGPSIIIVGAGVAGLACGVELIKNGIRNFKILEAENRIGGRVHTVPFADGVVDLGAQWVHGEKDNVVYEMVKNLGMLASAGDFFVSYDCFRSNGDFVPTEQTQRISGILEDLFMNRHDLMIDFDGSLGKFLEVHFFEALDEPQYEDIDREIAREFFENFKKMESSESSVGLNEVSARGFTEYWQCEGDYMLNWKEKGYGEIIRLLTHAQPGSNMLGILAKKVILGAKVQKIIWEQDNGLVSVICDNIAEPYVADNVVVTVSLGVLKKFANDMFDPPLPKQKLIAIEGVGYGEVLKVFIEFPYRFWSPTWAGFATLWREEDLDDLREKNMSWMEEIYGFYPINDRPRVLQAWAIGPTTLYIESLPRNELQQHLMNIMRRFLIAWRIPEPISILVTSWASNDNFCGAYSFRTLHTESMDTGAGALATPVNTLLSVGLQSDNNSEMSDADVSTRVTIKPTLLFAGEATSPHYFSTVHGAIESGWREAKRLAGYYDCEV